MAEITKDTDHSSVRVAYELAQNIASKEELYEDKKNYRKQLLDLYAECLVATSGRRTL